MKSKYFESEEAGREALELLNKNGYATTYENRRDGESITVSIKNRFARIALDQVSGFYISTSSEWLDLIDADTFAEELSESVELLKQLKEIKGLNFY